MADITLKAIYFCLVAIGAALTALSFLLQLLLLGGIALVVWGIHFFMRRWVTGPLIAMAAMFLVWKALTAGGT